MHPQTLRYPSLVRRCAPAASHSDHKRPLQLWSLCAASILLATTALSSQAVQAADTTAAAASALKVLALPLPDSPPPSGTSGAPAAAQQAVATPPPLPTSITVKQGESIDAVIRRGLPGLPLSSEFMRKALAMANPRIFPKGTTYPVRAGTVLQLPSHEALRQLMLAHYPHTAALFQAKPAVETDTAPGPDKRRWVRFP